MKTDLQDVPAGTNFRSDVCIVGAGVAGLLLATRLAKLGFSVNLLEAGGGNLEERSQELYNVAMAEANYAGATEARFRVFGGSSTRWGGQLLPLPDEVFRGRDALGGTGWPISRADIESYYAEVQDVMGVNTLPFTADLLKTKGHATILNSPDIRLRFSKWASFSRRNLARTLGRECLASGSITVFLHANVVAIELRDSADAVQSVTARDYEGREFVFRASEFILTAGTIETCRLLLASRSVTPEGVGNGNDLVGRYFHDHVSVPFITLTGPARAEVLRRFAPYFFDGTLHTPKLEASPELQARHGMLAVMAHIALEEPEESGLGAVRQVLRSLQRREWLTPPGKLLLGLPRGAVDIASAWYGMKFRQRRYVTPGAKVQIKIDTEQMPSAINRIRLENRVDAVGMPKAVIDWRVSADEKRTVATFAGELKRIFAAEGISGMIWPQDVPAGMDDAISHSHDTYHSMGGTRFGASEREGVVDADLRVHGVENLFVASCSVFPSGGSSNPTFTLMALTLRLAKHLNARRNSVATATSVAAEVAAS
jgi:choline dehydrogenase-like flavoprotein